MAEFFISGPLKSESSLEREVLEVASWTLDERGRFSTEVPRVLGSSPGGLSIECSLIQGLQLNYWLKTAHRVLLRLADFKATGLGELLKRLEKVPLRDWMGDSEFELQIDATRCRVSNEKFLDRKISSLWPKLREKASQKLYLRGFEDRWTLSLDSSGEHLHRRGLHGLRGEAPLRETLAALLVRSLFHGVSRPARDRALVVDPMAGSGTLLTEAKNALLPTRSRHFSFEAWGRTPALLKSPGFWGNYPPSALSSEGPQVYGVDHDPKMVEILKSLKLPCFEGPFSEAEVPASQGFRGLISNPPYGRRLEAGSWLEDFWPWALRQNFHRILLLVPADLATPVIGKAPRPPDRETTVKNGGVSCRALLWL